MVADADNGADNMGNILDIIDRLQIRLESLNIEIDGTISRVVTLHEFLEETFKHEKIKNSDRTDPRA